MGETIAQAAADLTLQRSRNQYTVNYDGMLYDVFEYLKYDGEPEPVQHKIIIYYADDNKEIVDEELEAIILDLLKRPSQGR